jgi:hypothetical protein
MDMDLYLATVMAQERLRDLRSAARRHALVSAARPARRPLRVVLGTALIRLGRMTLGESRAHRAALTS